MKMQRGAGLAGSFQLRLACCLDIVTAQLPGIWRLPDCMAPQEQQTLPVPTASSGRSYSSLA